MPSGLRAITAASGVGVRKIGREGRARSQTVVVAFPHPPVLLS